MSEILASIRLSDDINSIEGPGEKTSFSQCGGGGLFACLNDLRLVIHWLVSWAWRTLALEEPHCSGHQVN